MTGLHRYVAAIALLFLPVAANADEDDLSKRLIDSRFNIDIGVFYPQRELRIRVDGSVGAPINEPIDVQQELKLKDSDNIFSAEISWSFTERWRLSGQYFSLTNRHSAALSEDVEWQDVIYQAGSGISAGTNFDVTRVMVSRDFETASHHNYGVGFGVHMLRIEAFIEGQAFLQDGSTAFRRESVRTDGPMPDIGAWYKRTLSPRWALATRIDWMKASISPYDGSIVNASLGVDFALNKHIAASLDYNYFRVHAGIEDSGWRGEVRVVYRGPYLSLKAYW